MGVLDGELVADWAMKDDVAVGVFDVGTIELEGGMAKTESLDDWLVELDWLCVDELGVDELGVDELGTGEDTACALVEGCDFGC